MRLVARWALPIWTLAVWIPRIRNIWVDDGLAVGGQLLRTLWAVIFLVLAVAALTGRWWRVFIVWTVAFWVVRAVQIALADHDAGFIAVHVVLALVSIGLAVFSWTRLDEYAS